MGVLDEYELKTAKDMINEYCIAEFGYEADFKDLKHIGVCHTTLTDEDIPIQVEIDLLKMQKNIYVNNEFAVGLPDKVKNITFEDLACLDFDSLCCECEDVIEETKVKDNQSNKMNKERVWDLVHMDDFNLDKFLNEAPESIAADVKWYVQKFYEVEQDINITCNYVYELMNDDNLSREEIAEKLKNDIYSFYALKTLDYPEMNTKDLIEKYGAKPFLKCIKDEDVDREASKISGQSEIETSMPIRRRRAR